MQDKSGPATKETSQLISQGIKEMILSGKLKPGDSINQRVVAKALGVTTTPLREALSKLEQAGIIVRISGSGHFVAKFSINEIKQIFLIREVLDGLAARLCAEYASVEAIDKLASLSEEMDIAVESRDDLLQFELDMEFHRLLASSCGAAMLQERIETSHFLEQVFLIYSDMPAAERSKNQHAAILKAIRRKDGPAAEAAMREHIAKGFQSVIKHLQA